LREELNGFKRFGKLNISLFNFDSKICFENIIFRFLINLSLRNFWNFPVINFPNQPFWKEKFLAGLPILLGEKVRNKIKDTFTTKTIPYDQLTYGELESFTQKEGLKICQDLKLQKHLKWEMKRTRQELGSFCH
jgi:hypothetical protein